MAKNHGASIKNDEQYEALRKQGASKEKAARIANADRTASERGGAMPPYEQWTKAQLYERAQELEIEGRSKLNKSGLIHVLRDH